MFLHYDMEVCFILCIGAVTAETDDCRAVSKIRDMWKINPVLGIFLSYSFDAQGRGWKHRFGDQPCREHHESHWAVYNYRGREYPIQKRVKRIKGDSQGRSEKENSNGEA